MSDRDADTTVDRRLIDVPVPDHVLPRLRSIASPDDDELDIRLRAVSVPERMVATLQAIAADEQVDEQIRAVSIPSHVVPRVRTIPDRRRRSPIAQLTLAASLMLIISAGYLTALTGVLALFRPSERKELTLVIVDRGPLHLVSPVQPSVSIMPGPSVGDQRTLALDHTDHVPAITMVALMDRVKPGPAGQLAAEIQNVWDPSDNWLLMRWGVAGYSRVAENIAPDLSAVRAPSASGFAAPLTRSFDREFLYRRGVHPPMLIAADRAAVSVSPPLKTDTSSLQRVRQLVREGRRVSPDLIRTEEFLSAIDYQFAPAQPGALAIRTAAGPSVFNPSAAGLVQIGVKAGPCRNQPSGGTHLTVALDTSTAMKQQGRLELARHALQRVLPHLGPSDRVSLVIFSDEVVEIVGEAGAGDCPQISRLLDQLECSGDANLGAGLGQAISAAIETESDGCLRRRLVLITASRPFLTQKAAAGIRQMFDEAAKDDFEFEVFDLEADDSSHAAWSALASEAPCKVHSVRSADQLCWPLVETVTGASSLVANETVLQVDFNPKAVAGYRLIGHEATAMGGLLPGSAQCDLHVGQEATVLFEVWLYPNDEDDIAEVHLSWVDATSGQSRQARPQRISGIQFATSFEGSPVSLQAAAIAAETAEILRQSFNFAVTAPNSYRYGPKPSTFGNVIDAAGRVNAKLAERPSFQRLVRLIEEAESVRTDRKAVLAHAGRRGIIAGHWRESRE